MLLSSNHHCNGIKRGSRVGSTQGPCATRVGQKNQTPFYGFMINRLSYVIFDADSVELFGFSKTDRKIRFFTDFNFSAWKINRARYLTSPHQSHFATEMITPVSP